LKLAKGEVLTILTITNQLKKSFINDNEIKQKKNFFILSIYIVGLHLHNIALGLQFVVVDSEQIKRLNRLYTGKSNDI
jgi:hypothetical protein